MTREDKDLLLKDLCSRLPYLLQVGTESDNEPYTLLSVQPNKDIALIGIDMGGVYATSKVKIDTIKPYLRPMSSMTEEEKRGIYDWLVENDVDWFDFSKLRFDEILISFDSSWLLINWLNAHYFDYRGLIPKGIAISTEVFNPYKD